MSRCPEIASVAFLAAALALLAAPVAAETLGLGRDATPDEVAAWDIDIRPDGAGLPVGAGDVYTGEEVFAERCAICHGDFGEGAGRWPVLAGGADTLATSDPVKTVGSYWPYLSTVWDYVHRAMPFGDAQSLTDDEVYAIVAYILYLNDVVDDEFELSNENFGEIVMPNEAGFFPDDRMESAVWAARAPCMENCKPEVRITKRAAVIDVTPETGEEGADAGGAAEAEVAAASEPQAPEAGVDAALAEAGEAVFAQCKACHQVGEGAKNRVGPVLTGIVGAPVGAVDGFRYSRPFKTLAEEGAVWDDAALHAFLEAPRRWAKGTRMAFRGLADEEDRRAVIEYLRAASQ